MPAITRNRDRHACPNQVPQAHLKGKVRPGNWSVFAGGKKVAYRRAPCPCDVDDGTTNLLAVGVDDVHVGSDDVSHRWHTTAHGGIVIDGLYTVQIHAAAFDPIAAAIDRIAASPFGQTPRGKMIIEKLRRMHAEGKISINDEHPKKNGIAAFYDPGNKPGEERIVVNTTLKGEDAVESLAHNLAHEGTHALLDERQKQGYLSPSMKANERESWDNGSAVYEQQLEQGSNVDNDDLDEYDDARDKDAWIRERYGDEYFDR